MDIRQTGGPFSPREYSAAFTGNVNFNTSSATRLSTGFGTPFISATTRLPRDANSTFRPALAHPELVAVAYGWASVLNNSATTAATVTVAFVWSSIGIPTAGNVTNANDDVTGDVTQIIPISGEAAFPVIAFGEGSALQAQGVPDMGGGVQLYGYLTLTSINSISVTMQPAKILVLA